MVRGTAYAKRLGDHTSGADTERNRHRCLEVVDRDSLIDKARAAVHALGGEVWCISGA